MLALSGATEGIHEQLHLGKPVSGQTFKCEISGTGSSSTNRPSPTFRCSSFSVLPQKLQCIHKYFLWYEDALLTAACLFQVSQGRRAILAVGIVIPSFADGTSFLVFATPAVDFAFT
jgi:hypothetical protein